MKNILLLLLILVPHILLAGPSATTNEKPVEEYTEDDFESLKSDRLQRIRRELVGIRNEINNIKEKTNHDLDMITKMQLEAKIEKLEAEYVRKRNLFIETITNINLNLDDSKKKKTSFSEDIKQILDPALSTFKKISEKPRRMQELKEELNSLQEQYNRIDQANQKLKEFSEKTDQKVLKWKVKEAISITDKQEEKIKVKLEDLKFKILKMENTEESIVTTFSSIILEFIKTKGKNLLLALIVFVLFFWLFKLGQTKFVDLILYRLSRNGDGELYAWIIRPTRVIYSVLTTLVSFFLSILTLYVLNDWVLVTFVLIVFAALIWSSKQYLPLFLEQSKVVLNLGSVREGERVMFNGIPWKIETLGYYCKLKNPDLSGAGLRVSTKDLIQSQSRRSMENEPWFPSRVGDWVEVNDCFGEVIMQTPQQVIIRMIGGELKFFEANSFYSLGAKNYSKGYSIEFEFGLDYGLQESILTDVVQAFRQGIEKRIFEKHPELMGKIKGPKIDFSKANESSLDIRFFAQISGELAYERFNYYRSFQQEFVAICNEKSYVIPFKQLTIHQVNG